jgi:hypothetical protein
MTASEQCEGLLGGEFLALGFGDPRGDDRGIGATVERGPVPGEARRAVGDLALAISRRAVSPPSEVAETAASCSQV